MSPSLPAEETLERAELVARQQQRLSELLSHLENRSAFYRRKFEAAGLRVSSLKFPRDLGRLPLTTKRDLTNDQEGNPPWGTLITEPLADYTRYCQTSSTTGKPLRWIDTNRSWEWLLECWEAVFRGARVGRGDRIFFPFSFGPFLGFWAAFDAGSRIGAHCVPGGGMSSQVRLSLIESLGATVVCCTPTYALHLAEVAAVDGRKLREGPVRVVIVAGEPGGSIPATRERIAAAWGARVIDHHGLTEVGPLSFECWESPGFLHLNESRFLCEVLDPETHQPLEDGERGELVVTSLGRLASPVVRYRTGDLVVRRSDPCPCGRSWARLEGGILARADDMVNVRGVNVYPAAIEAVVRTFPEVVEFRSTVRETGTLRSLTVEIEPGEVHAAAGDLAASVARRLKEALGLTTPVTVVAPASLPRFEMKARRFVVEK